MILDTTFIIDLFRGNEDAIRRAIQLDDARETVFITSVSVFELWQGLDSKSAEKKKKLEEFVEMIGMLDLNAESAKVGGLVQSELVSKGEMIDPEDSMIAGIAIKHNHSILTRDRDYSRIKGLKLETY